MAEILSIRRRWLAVFCGGFAGAISRALLSSYIQAHLGKSWPYDILLINLSGAFLLACMTTLADATILLGPTRRLLINVGFLGAYTTFSSLMLGEMNLFFAGKPILALLYVAASLGGGPVAIVLGGIVGEWVIRVVQRASKVRSAVEELEGLRMGNEHESIDVHSD